MWQAYTGDVPSLEQAIAAPRLHVDADKRPPVLLCEPGVDTRPAGARLRHPAVESGDMFFGGIKLAGIEASGELRAIADLRREGAMVITVG